MGRYPIRPNLTCPCSQVFTIHTLTVLSIWEMEQPDSQFQTPPWLLQVLLSFGRFFLKNKGSKIPHTSIPSQQDLRFVAQAFAQCVWSVETSWLKIDLVRLYSVCSVKQTTQASDTKGYAPSIWNGTKLFSEFACTKAIKAWQHSSFLLIHWSNENSNSLLLSPPNTWQGKRSRPGDWDVGMSMLPFPAKGSTMN